MCNCNQDVQVSDCPNQSCCWKIFDTVFGQSISLLPESEALISRHLKTMVNLMKNSESVN